jgi:hypothetical protein
MRVPFPLHPSQHLLVVVFLMLTILIGVRWNLSVILICFSFMAMDAEHLFMCFWPKMILLEVKKVNMVNALSVQE